MLKLGYRLGLWMSGVAYSWLIPLMWTDFSNILKFRVDTMCVSQLGKVNQLTSYDRLILIMLLRGVRQIESTQDFRFY